MKFLLYSSTQYPDASSNGIANALERLGHGVSRWQRLNYVFPLNPMTECANLYKVDCFVFFGGPELTALDVRELKMRFPQSAFIMWNFDHMTQPETWKWFEPLARACHLCIQMDDSEPDKWAGINRIFCHMGIDPAIEQPYFGEITDADFEKYAADVAFMGMGYEWGGRKRVLDLVEDWCKRHGKVFKLWGVWTEFLIGDELAKMIKLTRVHLGHEPEGRPANHWSQRVYTILAHGGFYLAKYVPGYEQEFTASVDLQFWETEDGLLKAVKFVLDHDDYRAHIANHGCAKVRNQKTWDVRVSGVLPSIRAALEKVRA